MLFFVDVSLMVAHEFHEYSLAFEAISSQPTDYMTMSAVNNTPGDETTKAQSPTETIIIHSFKAAIDI